MKRKGKRIGVLLLAVSLLFGQLGVSAYAEGTAKDNGGLCEHHPEHTAECGYVEAVPCGHTEHTASCYTDELICGLEEDGAQTVSANDAAEPHQHTQDCYALDCPHERGEHDDTCGYVEGTACTDNCELCTPKDNAPVPGTSGQNVPKSIPGEAPALTMTPFGTTIDGAGYSYDPATHKLTITDDYGTTEWLNNGSIKKADIQSVEVEDSVTAIGNWAFLYCTNLTQISLPDNLESIGNATFTGCAKLALESLPADLKSIGSTAFQDCAKLALTSLPANLESIGNSAFNDCTSLALTSLPGSLESIGYGAFAGCDNLVLESLPDNWKSIVNSAFTGCDKLALTSLPDTVTSIGEYAFNGCENLALESLPANLESIGDSAFRGCTNLKSLTLPQKAPGLGKDVFYNCPDLYLIVPEGATGYDAGGWEAYSNEMKPPIYTITATPEALDFGSQTKGYNTPPTEKTVTITNTGKRRVTITSPSSNSYEVRPTNGNWSWNGSDFTATLEPDGEASFTVQPQTGLAEGEHTDKLTISTDHGASATVDLSFTVTPPGGGDDDNGSSSGNSGNHATIPPPAGQTTDTPTVGEITIGMHKDGVANIPTGQIESTLKQAQKDAEKNGRKENGVAISVKLPNGTTSATLDRTALDKLTGAGAKSLTLNFDGASMTFNLDALGEITKQSAGTVTFSVKPATLTGDAKNAIGTRPAFDFSLNYQNDGQPVSITNFGKDGISLAIHYTPAVGEQAGGLFAVCGDGGKAEWIMPSSFDPNSMVLRFMTHYLNIYGVGYKTPPAFSDITNHWAKADIDFVVSRGLFSGTSATTFSPDMPITRGMFVTALGRLAGIDPASYQSRSFTDVKADAYYAAYVEWAAKQNIVKGTGEGLFSPDTPVTREQMAVIMTNYARQIGYTIPTTLKDYTFTDNSSISAWAAKEVKAMQTAGIITGKDGNCFDPQGSATRAEVAAVLRRFVELVIDPATADGWTKNDSGHWIYYKDGNVLTGWWKIDDKWYYFDQYGIMAVNRKIDDYEVGPDGVRKE